MGNSVSAGNEVRQTLHPARRLERTYVEDEVRPVNVGGYLDSVKRLEGTYADILEVAEVKTELRDVFKDMRILVVGKSGSGKTTLIRLIVGDNGPRSMSTGTAGVQDINVEWHHPNPELPVIFHDSNGSDVVGPERLKVIRKFMDKHHNSRVFSQKIHLVWYVFSAADTRFLDDGDLLELLDTYGIPVLLVMTFNDIETLVRNNVTPSNFNKLLGRIKDVKKREKLKQAMVKIGNDMTVDKDGTLTGRKDVEGLKNVIHRTKDMIDKELRYTWISCQVIDINHKLDASASLIVRYKKAEVFGLCVFGALPFAMQLQLALMFIKVLRCLCKIWGVPPNLEKALFKSFFASEGGHCILRNLFHNLAASLGLLVSLAASVFTAGVATPAILGVMATAGVAQMKATPVLLMSYSFLILGAILYIKSNTQITRENWDSDTSVEDYVKYCEEFAASDYPKKLRSFAQESRSAWETTLRTKLQKERVKGQVISFFRDVMLNRPKSLSTVMQQTGDEEAHGAAAGLGIGENSGSSELQPALPDDGNGAEIGPWINNKLVALSFAHM